MKSNILWLLIALGISRSAFAMQLTPQNTLFAIEIQGDWATKFKKDAAFLVAGPTTILMSHETDFNSLELYDMRDNADVIASYLIGGGSLVLPEPITPTVLSNASRMARDKMKNNPVSQRVYAEKVKAHLDAARNSLVECGSKQKANDGASMITAPSSVQ